MKDEFYKVIGTKIIPELLNIDDFIEMKSQGRWSNVFDTFEEARKYVRSRYGRSE